MNRVKDYRSLAVDVVGWLCNYANENKVKSFVVGVSGGIDSAVSSTLAAKTGKPVYAAMMKPNRNIRRFKKGKRSNENEFEYLSKSKIIRSSFKGRAFFLWISPKNVRKERLKDVKL